MSPQMPLRKRALFITCEGGEGAGKTTLLRKLEKKMCSLGHEVVMTREPGGSKLGEHIRKWILERDCAVAIGAKAELLLFLAARAQHIEELIKPALVAGKIVLCDRFNDSTVVYQGIARGLGLDVVQSMCNLVCGDLVPDLTLFLDIAPVDGLMRASKRVSEDGAEVAGVDRIEAEKLEFHERVRQGFQRIAQQNPERFRTLDASRSPELVFAEAFQYIEPLLAK